MSRFFLNSTITDPQNIVISDKDIFNKITKVLRLNIGDTIFIFDISGEEYEVRIKEFKSNKVICQLITRLEIDRELPVEINLYQSFLKKDKFEWLVQKVTEIGVKSITPVISEFCVVREENSNKMERYRKIIAEATMQCGGKYPPVLNSAVSFEQAVRNLNQQSLNLICHEAEDDNLLANILQRNKKKAINIFIGPEGGFSQFEIDLARQNSVVPVSLGKRILRAETAAIVTCGTISQVLA